MIKINEKNIGQGCPCYIIAEIGVNHNGDVGLAQEMIRQAKQSGADAVKCQIITADRSYVRSSESYSIFKKLEFKKDQWNLLKTCAKELEIDFFATFVNSLDLLDYADFDFPAVKVSSTNITNFPYLKIVAQQKKPVILSTGLSYLDEVKEAVGFLKEHGTQQIAVMQCTALYPTPSRDANVLTIPQLKNIFPYCPVGFSDHTLGSHCALAAVALGADLIEKHFTLDKKDEGPDHHFSATPDELKSLIDCVRDVELCLGNSEKKPVSDEMPLRDKWMRSLVALRDIPEGEILTLEMIGIKRSPIKGMDPKDIEDTVGKRILRTISMDDPITKDLLC